MFRGRKEGTDLHISGLEPTHFLIQIRGAGFDHFDHGHVGFFATRGVSAPTDENAIAQLRAVVPVQLAPFGVPRTDFEWSIESVQVVKLSRILSFAPNGFTFFVEIES